MKAMRSIVLSLLTGLLLISSGSTSAADEPVSSPATQPTSCCETLPNRLHAVAETVALTEPTTAPSETSSGSSDKVAPAPAGMVWIPGGEFIMGSTDPLARPDEAPRHRVRVDGFWIDSTEVTNAQFKAFVQATGYKTVAERPIDWEELKKQLPAGTPKPDDDKLLPGSLVFTPPDKPVDTRHVESWWTWTTGANWQHPEGPKSSIDGKDNFPVVQVCYEDAVAYCKWADKRLPTEAEWEFAARGGLDAKVNVWGDEPVDPKRANYWQGHFPDSNTNEDGFTRAAPVKSFPPNRYGLYDMSGNLWEWCSDLYRPDTYARQLLEVGRDGIVINPAGPKRSLDPRNPDAPESRVQRGGSFLCNDSYCASYRPSARMACPPDTGLQHLGFRCVTTKNPPRDSDKN